jgi:hypothetical protein
MSAEEEKVTGKQQSESSKGTPINGLGSGVRGRTNTLDLDPNEDEEVSAQGRPAVYRLLRDPKRVIALCGAALFLIGANLLLFTVTNATGTQETDVTLWNSLGAGGILGKLSVIFLILGIVCLVMARIRGALLAGMLSLFLLAASMIVSALLGRDLYGEGTDISLGLGGLIALAGLVIYQTSLMMSYMAIVMRRNSQLAQMKKQKEQKGQKDKNGQH